MWDVPRKRYVSERVHFETPERPDSVIKLSKNYGLNDAQITLLVKKLPRLLLYNPDTLLPKLAFFGSLGFSGTDLANALFHNPMILTRSLEKCILPCFDMIKSIVVEDKSCYFL
ncbi:putative transcription regulator mTERF family [Rosa chinensis]|uniref:Putative transcription regulator mTERF family n=1 Tax=Rosa chinensis TaxID=74649 RepID=A0A2P6SGF0_ROSCH|nr:putative transcription regulator mTERF family [Rosa chinensis]